MKQIFFLLSHILILSFTQHIVAQCSIDSLKIYQVRAKDTDSGIDFNKNKHFVFINTACTKKNILLVYLVGTYGDPASTQLFTSMAANNGYHVVSLEYPNELAAGTACNNSTDPDCHEKFRREIIEGKDYSDKISVNKSNGIYNRLLCLLQYLAANHPEQNWKQFYTKGNLNFGKMIFAGHSQGGGHAAVIAIDNKVKRVLMFAAPNDWRNNVNKPATWTTKPHATPDSLYYGFANRFDDVANFSQQVKQWNALGLKQFGDTALIVNSKPPYGNSHELYTTARTNALICGEHCNVVVDKQTPKDKTGNPLYTPVWKYMLGISTSNPQQSAELNKPGKLIPVSINASQVILKNTGNTFIKGNIIFYDERGNIAGMKGNVSGENITLDLSNLQKGFYMVNLRADNGELIAYGNFISQ